MTDTMKGIYLECAAGLGLGDLTKLKTTDPKRKQIITECADGYIKATEDGNEHKRSQYISALMLMFWGYRLVQLMSKLPADYFDYFRRKYKVEDVVLQSALDKIKTSNNQKLYKYLELTLEDARTRLKVSKLI